MAKKYIVRLQDEERETLQGMLKSGIAGVRKQTRVRILLKADAGWSDEQISTALETSISTVERTRERYVEGGLEEALTRRPSQRKYRRLLDGEQEAHLVALTCGAPPEGHGRWSLRLLADQMVQLGYVETISHETVRHVLADNVLKPWQKREWCIPPHANAAFVYHLEDVLDVYRRPEDPRYPMVCFDETPVQLISEKRVPRPTQPGQVACYDCEYQREGTANLFMFVAPLQNWRQIKITARRTKVDWAHCMHDLVTVHFPHAERIVVVMDQLNTHNPAVLYEVFPPAEAKRILEHLEFHFTPKHGSWLNMAEIELSVVSRQCLARRIPNQVTLVAETQAWVAERNAAHATVDWRFTTDDARVKLKRLYPSIHG